MCEPALPNCSREYPISYLVSSLLNIWPCIRDFFFFQAEDGIRDYKVTGVQTCALPISSSVPPCGVQEYASVVTSSAPRIWAILHGPGLRLRIGSDRIGSHRFARENQEINKIGRASCRERVEIMRAAVVLIKKESK